MFSFSKHWSVMACFVLCCAALQPAHALIVNGVKYDEAIDVAGEKLQLNGAGTRYKAIFKVYTMGLYADKKVSTPEELWALPGNKRYSLTMLREIDASELGRLFTRGIEENNPRADTTRALSDIFRMSQVFGEYKSLKPGDTIVVDLIKGSGMHLSIKGKSVGEPFKDPAFFKTMLNIWLGKSPADWKLKEDLMGTK